MPLNYKHRRNWWSFNYKPKNIMSLKEFSRYVSIKYESVRRDLWGEYNCTREWLADEFNEYQRYNHESYLFDVSDTHEYIESYILRETLLLPYRPITLFTKDQWIYIFCVLTLIISQLLVVLVRVK